ncbi:MAG TPA: oligoendopeptidase F, partial [Bauldia sp.]|nr:oligoendopeptidase F [Bauldia sp.]
MNDDAPQDDPFAPPAKDDALASLGDLPEWNLDDLYAGMDSEALKRDLARAEADSVAFEERCKGQLAEIAAAADGGARLAAILKDFEALEELLGRIASYAGLLHAGDTTDPVRSKFYGDVQEKLTAASAHLLFFPLE